MGKRSRVESSRQGMNHFLGNPERKFVGDEIDRERPHRKRKSKQKGTEQTKGGYTHSRVDRYEEGRKTESLNEREQWL